MSDAGPCCVSWRRTRLLPLTASLTGSRAQAEYLHHVVSALAPAPPAGPELDVTVAISETEEVQAAASNRGVELKLKSDVTELLLPRRGGPVCRPSQSDSESPKLPANVTVRPLRNPGPRQSR